MASLILGSIGNASFGPIGGFLGALAGARIDGAISSKIAGYKVAPSRLSSLKIQSSQDGASVPIVFGKMRISGQIIWASDFKETQIKRQIGGKNGQKVKENYYSISFAIGICEGEISGIGQVWINGEKSDLSKYEHRIYHGVENQEIDPLIEAILGVNNVPNYNGIAYIVFEDMPLAEFGDRIPQMAFEVFRRPKNQAKSIEELIESVCLIPGAGEFCYATTPIIQKIRKGKEKRLNQHQSSRDSDLIVALNNLKRDLPNVKNISLVAAWFGNDLRAEFCQIMPRVDSYDKATKPRQWSAAGLNRASAQLVSNIGESPAYGGSPDDASLIEAIKEIKVRGISVTFNPFIMMDIPSNNNLPNPNGGASQGAYPWRGRISCMPAIGQQQSAQGTINAKNQIDAFYGNVTAADFVFFGTQFSYNGPSQWSYSRFILHMAALCKIAGGVDCFLIGSEMVGLTRVKDSFGNWVFVDCLIQLAAEVRTILGANTKISYGADWTEYGAYFDSQTNNTHFPLDALWASNNIDFIGIDYYAPLSDRGSNDAQLYNDEIKQNIESGEGFEYFYSDDVARFARNKTLISDNVYNEPWVYRPKDIRGFWKNAHHERLNGVRNSNPTAWIPKSKPIQFMEFGVAAIDRGANRPSVFPDAKSIENGIPPFSLATRNDAEQRNSLSAFLSYWQDNNEISPLYNGDMINSAKTYIWAWDARPFPAFPNRIDVWSDGVNYEKGHWIMGRMGLVPLASIIDEIGARAAISFDSNEVIGSVDGYIIEQNQNARECLEPIMSCFGVEHRNNNFGLKFYSTPPPEAYIKLRGEQLIIDDELSILSHNYEIAAQFGALDFQSYCQERDYQVLSARAINCENPAQSIQFSAPIVTDFFSRNIIANRLLRKVESNFVANLEVANNFALQLEVNDRVQIDDGPIFRIDKISGLENTNLSLVHAPEAALRLDNVGSGANYKMPIFNSAPMGFILDLPHPFSDAMNPLPIAFCACEPWRGAVDILLEGEVIASADKCAIIGELIEELPACAVSSKINRKLKVRIDFGLLGSGASIAAIMHNNEIIDIISWESVEKIGSDTFELSHIIRGLNGIALAPIIPNGSTIIILDNAGVKVSLKREFWKIDIVYDFARLGENADQENSFSAKFSGVVNIPWAPCHIKCKRQIDGINISFVPRSAGFHIGLEAADEIDTKFKISILELDGSIKREIISTNLQNIYDSAAEMADFGAPVSQLYIKIAQFSHNGELGHEASGLFQVYN